MQIDIRDFQPGDEIVISKTENGHQIRYTCSFITFKNGIVTGSIKSVDPSWADSPLKRNCPITARITKCFIRRSDWVRGYNRLSAAVWFNNKGIAQWHATKEESLKS